MPGWLKILLTGVTSFGSGAAVGSQTNPDNTNAILLTGALAAANAIAGLFIRKPSDDKKLQ